MAAPRTDGRAKERWIAVKAAVHAGVRQERVKKDEGYISHFCMGSIPAGR